MLKSILESKTGTKFTSNEFKSICCSADSKISRERKIKLHDTVQILINSVSENGGEIPC